MEETSTAHKKAQLRDPRPPGCLDLRLAWASGLMCHPTVSQLLPDLQVFSPGLKPGAVITVFISRVPAWGLN